MPYPSVSNVAVSLDVTGDSQTATYTIGLKLGAAGALDAGDVRMNREVVGVPVIAGRTERAVARERIYLKPFAVGERRRQAGGEAQAGDVEPLVLSYAAAFDIAIERHPQVENVGRIHHAHPVRHRARVVAQERKIAVVAGSFENPVDGPQQVAVGVDVAHEEPLVPDVLVDFGGVGLVALVLVGVVCRNLVIEGRVVLARGDGVRLGEEGEDFRGDRVDARSGDDVARERRPRVIVRGVAGRGIVDHDRRVAHHGQLPAQSRPDPLGLPTAQIRHRLKGTDN